MPTRLESDSIGTLEVPAKAYYGVQSLRAKNNFAITARPLHPAFINNLARIKKAAAMTNMTAHVLNEDIGNAIIKACDEILAGKLHNQFIVDAIQGGAGTSANMNANEVIANRAIELMGGEKGDYSIVHPNDHVNMAQSTNDVIPCAGKLTIMELLPDLLHELKRLQKALTEKAVEFDDVVKIFDGTGGGAGGFDFSGMDMGDIFGDIFGDFFGGGGARRRGNDGPTHRTDRFRTIRTNGFSARCGNWLHLSE